MAMAAYQGWWERTAQEAVHGGCHLAICSEKSSL
jgi:hypothetical protein